jgi:basic endochitinase B
MRYILVFLIFLSAACKSQSGYVPIKDRPDSTTNLTKYLSDTAWNRLFPNRYGKALSGPNAADSGKTDFYSFAAFVAAAKKFPDFLSQGDDTARLRELAAFLAHAAQETSGGWASAPGGYYAWGLYFKQEQGCENGCPQYSITTNKDYPPVPGQSYHGRGPLQLSYSYQYGLFSEAWFGDKEVLLKDPDLLSRDSVLAFASAIWFWMTPEANKPSCHAVMTGLWHPTKYDIAEGRKPGFGTTLNIINGGVECDMEPAVKTLYRYSYYQYFCDYLHVSPGPNIECTDQIPFSKDE